MLILASLVLLVCAAIDFETFSVGLNICVITAGIKKEKSIIKKNKKKYDEIVLLGITKFDAVEVLISKVLIY